MNRMWVLAAAFACGLAGQPVGAAEGVDVELVLLADASRSIDDDEIRFQREGYAGAIVHPEVLAAIGRGYHRRVVVAYVEWGDADHQVVVVPWTVIDGPDPAVAFAAALMAAPRIATGANAIGSALAAAHALIDGNAWHGERRVIDFSADSANSFSGIPLEIARQTVLASDIVINGLAVLCRVCSGPPVGYDLAEAFRDRVTGGRGSFVVAADSRERFPLAVRRKLLLEIAGGDSNDANRFASAD